MALSVSFGTVDTSLVSTVDDKLAFGLLNIYQPPLEKVQSQLQELGTKQTSLIAELEEENKRLADPLMTKQLLEMHSQIKTYTAKLVVLKKEMHQTAEKAALIKKRALRLQMAKQKDALLKESRREMQLQQEQELIAKPASSKAPAM